MGTGGDAHGRRHSCGDVVQLPDDEPERERGSYVRGRGEGEAFGRVSSERALYVLCAGERDGQAMVEALGGVGLFSPDFCVRLCMKY